MKPQPDEFLGDLILGKRLSSTMQVISVGLIIAFGLVFIIPSRTLGLAGSASATASILILAVLVLTALNILELLAGSSEYGGTYTLVHETLGSEVGFFAGWSILAGCVALAEAMIQVAAHHLTTALQGWEPFTVYLSLGFVTVLFLVQLFQFLPRGDLRLHVRPLSRVIARPSAQCTVHTLPRTPHTENRSGRLSESSRRRGGISRQRLLSPRKWDRILRPEQAGSTSSACAPLGGGARFGRQMR